jgi:hypothetical protein
MLTAGPIKVPVGPLDASLPQLLDPRVTTDLNSAVVTEERLRNEAVAAPQVEDWAVVAFLTGSAQLDRAPQGHWRGEPVEIEKFGEVVSAHREE